MMLLYFKSRVKRLCMIIIIHFPFTYRRVYIIYWGLLLDMIIVLQIDVSVFFIPKFGVRNYVHPRRVFKLTIHCNLKAC